MGNPAPHLAKPATAGQAAYEAYSESLGGKSGVTGQPLPEWASDKVTPAIKAGWEAAASASVKFLDAIAAAKAAA